MKQDEPKLLRRSLAAHEVGLHPFTVRKWIKQGKIQAIWVGKKARVPRAEIERLVGTSAGRAIVLYGRVRESVVTSPDRLARLGKSTSRCFLTTLVSP